MLLRIFVLLFTCCFSSAGLAQSNPPPKPNGEFWLKGSEVPQQKIQADSTRLGPSGGGSWFIGNSVSASTALDYGRALGRWIDPTTAPQSRTDCVQWASGSYPWGGGWRTCTGWRTQFRYMYTTLRAHISTGVPQDISGKLDQCMNTAAVSGALAAIMTSGSAGLAAFQATLSGCLASNLASFVNLAVWTDSAWEDEYH